MVCSDPDGAADLAQCYMLINTTLSAPGAAYVLYDANTNLLYLRNDANTGWGTGCAPGYASVLQNSQCKLYCADTTVVTNGNNRTVNYVIEIKPTQAGKTFQEWMWVADKLNANSGYVSMGSVTATAPAPA
jgi:hypothetical protein